MKISKRDCWKRKANLQPKRLKIKQKNLKKIFYINEMEQVISMSKGTSTLRKKPLVVFALIQFGMNDFIELNVVSILFLYRLRENSFLDKKFLQITNIIPQTCSGIS